MACEFLGPLRNAGLGQQPDVYKCSNPGVAYSACTLANPTGHIFKGKTLSSCDTCPLFKASKSDVHAPSASLPPLVVRGLNFARALARWAAAGFATRSQDTIAERLAICQECPHFVKNHCAKCGCACVEKNRLMNKLALASEKCPIGKWE